VPISCSCMRVVFADQRLGRILTDEAHRLGLPIAVIKAARKKLLALEAASDERTLRGLKSLNFKQLSGDREGLRQIRINDQYRIVFTLDESTRPHTVTILEIDDTH
jgi:toxin HigB-1